MALTITSTPQPIDSNAVISVETSLTESSSYNNLRIRAELYHDGEIVAVSEKPKGLSDFDFSDILKTLMLGVKKTRGSVQSHETGSVGSQLIASWGLFDGYFDTLSTSGNVINSAISTGTGTLVSNSIAMQRGELYVLVVPDLVSSGVNRPQIRLSQTGGPDYTDFYPKKSYILMPIEDNTYMTLLVGFNNYQNFSGTFNLYKITTDKEAVGSALVPYFVNFTEVYEDSSGVTQTYYTKATIVFRYARASSQIASFADYVLSGSGSKFANLNYRAGASKYYSSDNVEQWLMFFTDLVDLDLYQAKNGGSMSLVTQMMCYEGWGIIILDSTSMASVTSQSSFRIDDGIAASAVSETLTVLNDTKCSATRVILEYTGFLGGVESMCFEGDNVASFKVSRDFYRNVRGVRKPIRQKGVGAYRLQTKLQDMYTADYLPALLLADDVKMLIALAQPVDVTVITDNGTVNSSEIFNNEIEIEYDYGY